MIIAQRVNDFLTKRRPDEVCDLCIADHLKLRHQQANKVTMALGTTNDFTRAPGVCADCDRELITTRRNESTVTVIPPCPVCLIGIVSPEFGRRRSWC